MKAVNLLTEYLHNPIGIDVTAPVLFWTCLGGKKQTAYRVVARSDGDITWDSGKTLSSSMRCTYPEKLVSRQRVTWSVCLWDENDNSEGWSEEAFFEMGLLDSADWKAEWITGDYSPSKKKRYPVDCFKKDFEYVTASGAASSASSGASSSGAPLAKARLYVSACGLYEAQINGVKVGEDLLTPGSTDYWKRIQYQEYDVADMIDTAGAAGSVGTT